jgi:hypothetical protein
MFNPDTILNAQFDQATSTEFLVVPEGEYVAQTRPITAQNFRSVEVKKQGSERFGQKMTFLDIQWEIDDPKLKEEWGRTPVARQSLILEFSPDGNALEFGKGKNVSLGKLREAFGQNMTGRPWAFSMLGGQAAKIRVKHRLDGDQIYAEVSEVSQA